MKKLFQNAGTGFLTIPETELPPTPSDISVEELTRLSQERSPENEALISEAHIRETNKAMVMGHIKRNPIDNMVTRTSPRLARLLDISNEIDQEQKNGNPRGR